MNSTHIIIIFAVSFIVLLIIAFWSRSRRKEAVPSQRAYLEALKALVAGEDKIAFQRFKQVVVEDTNNVDAYLKLGDLFRKKGTA